MRNPRHTVPGVMALAFAVVGGCATEQQSENVGEVALTVRIIPAEVRCVRVALDQSGIALSRSFDSIPGTSLSAHMGGLPMGSGVLTAQAFDAACTLVTTGSEPRWVSDPVGVVVSRVPTRVSLTLRPSGARDADRDLDGGARDADRDFDGGARDAGRDFNDGARDADRDLDGGARDADRDFDGGTRDADRGFNGEPERECPAGQGKCPISEPIGWWTFDEASGATVNDVGSKNQTGTIVTGKVLAGEAATAATRDVMGKSGNALTAAGQWVRVPASATLDLTGHNGAVTVSSWVKLTRDPGQGWFSVVTRAEYGSVYQQFGLGITHGIPSAEIHATPTAWGDPLPIGRWVHLAMTYDGITVRVYRDGNESASQDIGYPILDDVTPLIIGARQARDTIIEFFPGSIDDVRLFNRELTADEIKALAM